MTSERVLARLIHSRRARSTWREQGLAASDVSPEVAAELATLDPIAVEKAAAAVRRHVIERTHSGVGTIVDAFPRTIAAWRERMPSDRDLDELAATFLDSPAAAAWRETPAHTVGTTLEEAFYQFATAEQLGDPAARETERLSVLIRMLAIDGTAPAYDVPGCVQRRAGVAWAISNSVPPTLFATVDGRIMIGTVTKLVADLLAGDAPEEAGPKSGVTAEAAQSVRTELCEMRLLQP